MESVLNACRELQAGPHVATATVAPLRELITEHRPYVRASLRHLGVSADQLDDAEQDLFLVLVRRKDDFDATRGTSYRGWMWGMCRNVAATYRRKTRRARRHDNTLDTPVRPPIEERVAAHQVLAALDESSRVLWLGRCEGRSARELADTLSLPLTTVEWRLRQARHAVKTALRGLERRAGAWIGWLLRPQQGLAVLAVPAIAMFALARPPSEESSESHARLHVQSTPDIHTTRTRPIAAPQSPASRPPPGPVVAHVEEHEPTISAIGPRLRTPRARPRVSGRVALGDPSVDHP